MPFDSILFWLLILLGVLLTGISKSGFAGSLGVVTVPLMSLVIPIEQAAALMLPVLIAMDAKVIQYYYKHLRWPIIAAVLPSACIGIAVAGWLMGNVSATLLQGVLGGVCIVFACWHRLNTALGRIPGAGLLWGGIAGFTSTLIHAGGPPMNIYFAGKQLPKQQWLACAGVFFGIINVVKVVPYLYLNLWSGSLLLMSIVVLPVAWLGVWLGRRIQGVFSDQVFLVLSRILVFLSGVLLLYKALIV